MQTLSTNGEHIHFLQEGPSHLPVMVFSNSLGTDMRVWDPLLPLLKHQFQFLRYDKRGHGLSTISGDTSSIQDHIDDLINLLDHLALKEVILVGLSVGGLISQGVAAQRPDLVSRLVICDSAPQLGPQDGWNARIEAIKANGLASIGDAVMERWFAKSFRESRPAELALWQNMFARTYQDGYIACCTAIRDADLTESTRTLDLPVLCVVGDEDGATPPEMVENTAKLIKGAEFKVIANAGHLPCVEQPAALAKLIAEFIAKHQALETRFDTGMKVRRSVLGDAHVNRAEANKTNFDLPFQTFITEGAWGSVWSRPGLSKRDRSLITIALLASLSHDEELAMHIRATLNTGASVNEVKETLLHIGVYAGVPVSNIAIRIAKETYAGLGIDINEEHS